MRSIYSPNNFYLSGRRLQSNLNGLAASFPSFSIKRLFSLHFRSNGDGQVETGSDFES
jgi:hypothetical protein